MRRLVAVAAAFIACCVLAGAFAVGPVAGQSAADANGTIDACTVVDEPGAYDLAGDVQNNESASCIVIQSSDVTLDGNGHAVEGPGASSDGADGSPAAGILVDGDGSESYDNVTVEDVTVTGFDEGIQAGTGGFGDDTEVAIVDVTVTDAGRGIALRGGNATLSGVTVEDTDAGVDAVETGAIDVFDVTLRNNGYGLNAAETGPVYVETSTVEDNDGDGVSVSSAASLDTYAVDVTGNGGSGVTATGTDAAVRLSDGAVSDNDEAGLRLRGGAVAELDGTDVSGNGADGVRATDDAEVTLYGVTAGDNDGWELDARGGNATARDFQVAPSARTSFNSGPVALEPTAQDDLPSPPENRTFVADGLNVTDSGMPIGMTFEVDDHDDIEVWRHDGSEWLLEGNVTMENGTAGKYNSADGVFAPAVVESNDTDSNDNESDDGTPTPTPTDDGPADDGSSDADDSSNDLDISPGGPVTTDDESTPTPTATESSNGTAASNETVTPTATATPTATDSSGETGGDGQVAAAEDAQADEATDDASDEESGFALADGNGFGVAVALLALLAGTLLAHRRR